MRPGTASAAAAPAQAADALAALMARMSAPDPDDRPPFAAVESRLAAAKVEEQRLIELVGEAVRATTLCDASGAPVEDQSGAVTKFSALVPQLASVSYTHLTLPTKA